MAIIKRIEQPNGVVLEYHRIESVRNTTNINSIIQLKSYISKEKREYELKVGLPGTDYDITYNVRKDYVLPYDKDLNVDSAYEYLKTLPEFENSIDD